jgi:hypothetical protein
MAAASLHIQFYLDKLMAIDKNLGGTAASCNYCMHPRKKGWR